MMVKRLIKMILDLLEEEFPETYHSIPDSVSKRSGSWFIFVVTNNRTAGNNLKHAFIRFFINCWYFFSSRNSCQGFKAQIYIQC